MPRGPLVTLGLPEHRAQLESLVHRGCRAFRGCRETWVPQVRRECKGSKVFRGPQVLQAPLVALVPLVQLAPRAIPVTRAQQVQPAAMVQLAQLELLVLMVLQPILAQQAPLVQLEWMEYWEEQVLADLRDQRVQLVRQPIRVPLELRGPLAPPVPLDHRESKEFKEFKEMPDPQAPMALQAQMVLKET